MALQEIKAHVAHKAKLTILLFCITLSSSLCFSQVKPEIISVKKLEDIKKMIAKNYQVEQGFLDTACLDIVILLKFKIINKKIDSLQFSKTTPLPIITAIKKALHLNEGELYITDAKAFKNKNIAIPIIFTYLTRCKTPPGMITVQSNGALSISEDLKADKSLKPTLLNFLDFEGKNMWSIDCILMSPMAFTTMY